MLMQNPVFSRSFQLCSFRNPMFLRSFCVSGRPPRPQAWAPQSQLRAKLTVKTHGFEHVEDNLTEKTQGFGNCMLAKPFFLRCFRSS